MMVKEINVVKLGGGFLFRKQFQMKKKLNDYNSYWY